MSLPLFLHKFKLFQRNVVSTFFENFFLNRLLLGQFLLVPYSCTELEGYATGSRDVWPINWTIPFMFVTRISEENRWEKKIILEGTIAIALVITLQHSSVTTQSAFRTRPLKRSIWLSIQYIFTKLHCKQTSVDSTQRFSHTVVEIVVNHILRAAIIVLRFKNTVDYMLLFSDPQSHVRIINSLLLYVLLMPSEPLVTTF